MKVNYFANPNSVHVHRWLGLVPQDVEILGFTVHEVSASNSGAWRRTGWLSGAVRYVAAGLQLRFSRLEGAFIHAHNASGYGLMAYMSGAPYILTVYGSEIYAADTKGPIYRALMRRIVNNASIVTCTSRAMEEYLASVLGVRREAIDMFSLGIALDHFKASPEARQRARTRMNFDGLKVITSNRRMQPQYRIDLILNAFSIFRSQEPNSHLVLFEGDSDLEYKADLRRAIDQHRIADSVTIVEGMRSPAEVRDYLIASDIVISIPTSDQMSASILEAAACGCYLVVSAIDAYAEIISDGIAQAANVESPSTLADTMLDASRQLNVHSASGAKRMRWLEEHHSDTFVAGRIAALYRRAAFISDA
jgi:glycosyltransferase involved in cell wall biosynthesis